MSHSVTQTILFNTVLRRSRRPAVLGMVRQASRQARLSCLWKDVNTPKTQRRDISPRYVADFRKMVLASWLSCPMFGSDTVQFPPLSPLATLILHGTEAGQLLIEFVSVGGIPVYLLT